MRKATQHTSGNVLTTEVESWFDVLLPFPGGGGGGFLDGTPFFTSLGNCFVDVPADSSAIEADLIPKIDANKLLVGFSWMDTFSSDCLSFLSCDFSFSFSGNCFVGGGGAFPPMCCFTGDSVASAEFAIDVVVADTIIDGIDDEDEIEVDSSDVDGILWTSLVEMGVFYVN